MRRLGLTLIDSAGAAALDAPMSDDPRQYAPAAARNREPILAVLRRVLPASGRVLEIASGTGEHVVHFAQGMPGQRWRPSDPDEAARASIAAWIAALGLANVEPPLALDVCAEDWNLASASPFDALVCINMIHIAPWEATPALFDGAARVVRPGGAVFLYGPFMREGAHTAPSNQDFDAWLKQRDPRFGVRALEDVADVAAARGFTQEEVAAMPANNFSVVFRRA